MFRIHAIETKRLYRQIAEQLADSVALGELKPGDRLPAESELAHQFGVSRPSVREAIISLEMSELVEVRVGTGVFVRERQEPARLAVGDAGPGPFELLEARRQIEGEIAALAARAATAADLDSISAALEQMVEAERNHAPAIDADQIFHERIAAATGNSAYVFVVRLLWEQHRGAMWNKFIEHVRKPEVDRLWIDDHFAVLEGLRRRDPDRARAAMRRHLENVERQLSSGWNRGDENVVTRLAELRQSSG